MVSLLTLFNIIASAPTVPTLRYQCLLLQELSLQVWPFCCYFRFPFTSRPVVANGKTQTSLMWKIEVLCRLTMKQATMGV
jgi:hypothetical protein